MHAAPTCGRQICTATRRCTGRPRRAAWQCSNGSRQTVPRPTCSPATGQWSPPYDPRSSGDWLAADLRTGDWLAAPRTSIRAHALAAPFWFSARDDTVCCAMSGAAVPRRPWRAKVATCISQHTFLTGAPSGRRSAPLGEGQGCVWEGAGRQLGSPPH